MRIYTPESEESNETFVGLAHASGGRSTRRRVLLLWNLWLCADFRTMQSFSESPAGSEVTLRQWQVSCEAKHTRRKRHER